MRTSLDLPDDLYEKIKEQAKADSRTVAGQIRFILANAVKGGGKCA
jgi:hypothetical protein